MAKNINSKGIKKLIYTFCLISSICFAQESSFDKMIDSTLQKTVPFINASELAKNYTHYTILDTRELKEYETSHLKGATHVGYNKFKYHNLKKIIATEKPIVVYCTVGYRSEKIGEKLLKKGHTVYNLYGGILQWKNNNNTVINSANTITNKVHCFDITWGKWLVNGEKKH